MLYYASVKIKKPAICFTDAIQTIIQADDVKEVSNKLKEFMQSQNIEILDIVVRPLKLNESSIIVLKRDDILSFSYKEKHIDTKAEAKLKKEREQKIQKALATRMPFGKYKDITLGELMEEDVSYLHWLLQEDTAKGLLRTSLNTLQHRIEDSYDEVMAERIPEEYRDAIYAALPNT